MVFSVFDKWTTIIMFYIIEITEIPIDWRNV